MASTAAISATNFAEREILITRLFDVSRELMFQAWTDPKHLLQWAIPNGFTHSVYEMNVKPGGVWRFGIRSSEGIEYRNKIVYLDLVNPSRLVYVHGSGEEDEPGQFHVTVNFVEEAEKTRLTMQLLFESVAACRRARAMGAVEGGNASLDCLEAHLQRGEC
jgi:uncharacterized protein YndB with AHSA1/START domain